MKNQIHGTKDLEFQWSIDNRIIDLYFYGTYDFDLNGEWWITKYKGNTIVLKKDFENERNCDELHLTRQF